MEEEEGEDEEEEEEDRDEEEVEFELRLSKWEIGDGLFFFFQSRRYQLLNFFFMGKKFTKQWW